MEDAKTQLPITPDAVEALRHAGYVIVPLYPSEAMICAGAPLCFLPYDGSWELARRDALECYRAMVDAGRL